MTQLEGWAKEWLDGMRSRGKKGISVEVRNGVHQLRWQTTEWDPVTRKRVKRGNYIGTLVFPGRVVLAKGLDVASLDERAREAFDLRVPAKAATVLCDQRVSGNIRLLERVCRRTFDLFRAAFPSPLADDLWMLAMSRLHGQGRLVRAGRWFSTTDNVFCLSCHTDPEALSESLRIAGMSSSAQMRFFESLTEPGITMAADMTVIFSRSRGTFLVKKGYNRFHLSCGQFNVVIICSLDGGLPIGIRTVAGNVKEGSLVGMLKEFDIGDDVVLVMDRGYDVEEIRDVVDDSGRFFVIPVDRSSTLYGTVHAEEGAFVFEGDTVRFGIGDGFGYRAFRFENMSQRNTELRERIEDAGGILLGPMPDKAGNLILLTNLDATAEDVYRLYKCRCEVEQAIDTSKSLLAMEATYMHDSFHVMGFNFVTFLTLRIRTELRNLLASRGFDPKLTVEDVLFIYSNATVSKTSEGTIMEYVPADLRCIDSKLGVDLYLKNPE